MNNSTTFSWHLNAETQILSLQMFGKHRLQENLINPGKFLFYVKLKLWIVQDGVCHENVVLLGIICIFAWRTEVTKKLEKRIFNEILHSMMRLLPEGMMTWTFPSLCYQS